MSEYQEEFIIFNNSSGKSNEVKTWSHHLTLTLLDLFKKYRNKVGSLQLRNLKKLWELIKSTAQNFLLRFVKTVGGFSKEIIRKLLTTIIKQEEGRKCFEFQNEMDDIFGNKRNIHPELLLSSDTIHVIPTNVEKVTESNADKLKDIAEDLDGLQPGTTFQAETQVIEKNKTTATSVTSRRKRTQSRNCTLQLIRHDKNLHHKELMSIQKERLEIEKQKLKERQTRNQLVQERNDILKMYLNQTLQLPNDLFSM